MTKMLQLFILVLLISTMSFGADRALEDLTLDQFNCHIKTNDSQLDSLIMDLFNKTVVGKLYKPIGQGLPNNWFSPGGGYVGQWVWDTMFVTTAYAALGDDKNIRNVFENYWYTMDNNPEAPKDSYRYGMIPNFLKDWPPLGYSQIPIIAWGCELAYRQSNDRELIERALDYLISFDNWYSTERDVDNDGLIEYGMYKPIFGTDMAAQIQTARFETFDNHASLDNMKLTEHPERKDSHLWYGNVEGVEQTCFLIMSERSIVRLANELGKPEIAKKYQDIIDWRIKAIQEKMWDPQTKFFYSLDRDTDKQIKVKTLQGFLTMTAKVATADQAEELVSQLKDKTLWWTDCPVPTTCLKEKTFEPTGFWRGDMWPPTTYLVSLGLNNYHYYEIARQLSSKMRNLIAEKGVNERYNSLTSEPLGADGLGMTCSIWLMLIQNEFGLQDDFSTIVVPANAKGKSLKLGKIEISYPGDDSVKIKSAFDRDITVIFNDKPTQVFEDDKPLTSDKFQSAQHKVSFTAKANKAYLVNR